MFGKPCNRLSSIPLFSLHRGTAPLFTWDVFKVIVDCFFHSKLLIVWNHHLGNMFSFSSKRQNQRNWMFKSPWTASMEKPKRRQHQKSIEIFEQVHLLIGKEVERKIWANVFWSHPLKSVYKDLLLLVYNLKVYTYNLIICIILRCSMHGVVIVPIFTPESTQM